MNRYWNWLANVDNMWHGKMKKYMDFFDNPRELYNASVKMLEKSKVMSDKEIEQILSAKKSFDLNMEYEKMLKKGINITFLGDKYYPERLNIYDDKPYMLYYKGILPGVNEKLVAMVGARICTNYGREISKSIAEGLGKYDIGVVSGMAKGIDAYSHSGCMSSGGKTYAVLGNGVDICYPRENFMLYEEMKLKGGIISEYPPGAKPLAWRFPYRNRIISMLSDIILVVEAKERSGTFITVDYGLEYGKDIFVVPGRVNDELSKGCNRLIKTGAYVYTDLNDLLDYFGITTNKKIIKKNIMLEKDFEVVYSCLGLYETGIEKIAEQSGCDIARVYEVLLKLKLEGMVEEVYHNHYVKKL